jgi:hypothetical protein
LSRKAQLGRPSRKARTCFRDMTKVSVH